MKFSGSGFVIDKKYTAELDTKKNVFPAETGTKKILQLQSAFNSCNKNFYT